MAHHDLIVIGASSGGVGVLTKLVADLPEDVAAAIFVVLHVRADRPSQLPAILNRAGRIPVAHAVDGEPVRRGRVYVAPPGFQTYVHRGRISVRRGPIENNHRPAIDPLFRTAAHYYGPRVIGVVLSGALDDGAAGLLAIKESGGIAIVQDPSDAVFPDMPVNALEMVNTNLVVRGDELAHMLIGLVGTLANPSFDPMRSEVALETVEEAETPEQARRSEQLGPPASFSCPDCQGTLYEVVEHDRVRFRCRVGHAYSEESMLKAHGDSVERALWSALRALEERTALMRKLAEYARRRGHTAVAGLYEERMQQTEADVRAIHDLVTNGGSLEPVGQDGI